MGGRTCKKTDGEKGGRIPPFIGPHESNRWQPTNHGTTAQRAVLPWSGTIATGAVRPTVLRGSVPCPLPPLTEGLAVVGAVVAMVLPPGGTTALPGGTTALRYYRGAVPFLLPPLTEDLVVLGAWGLLNVSEFKSSSELFATRTKA